MQMKGISFKNIEMHTLAIWLSLALPHFSFNKITIAKALCFLKSKMENMKTCICLIVNIQF